MDWYCKNNEVCWCYLKKSDGEDLHVYEKSDLSGIMKCKDDSKCGLERIFKMK